MAWQSSVPLAIFIGIENQGFWNAKLCSTFHFIQSIFEMLRSEAQVQVWKHAPLLLLRACAWSLRGSQLKAHKRDGLCVCQKLQTFASVVFFGLCSKKWFWIQGCVRIVGKLEDYSINLCWKINLEKAVHHRDSKRPRVHQIFWWWSAFQHRWKGETNADLSLTWLSARHLLISLEQVLPSGLRHRKLQRGLIWPYKKVGRVLWFEMFKAIDRLPGRATLLVSLMLIFNAKTHRICKLSSFMIISSV